MGFVSAKVLGDFLKTINSINEQMKELEKRGFMEEVEITQIKLLEEILEKLERLERRIMRIEKGLKKIKR